MMRISAALMMTIAAAIPSASQGGSAVHTVIASSFADPKDIADYKKCVAQGRRDCLSVGDNGVGLWGDDTTDLKKPGCALPRGVWRAQWGGGDAARRKPIVLAYRGLTATCALIDTLPSHPKHGVGIDLNPGAAKLLGLRPPFLVRGVKWRWG